MKSKNWKKCILHVVTRISDRSYQEKSWFAKSNIMSSPEELYCELFDDYMFDEFLKSKEVSMTHLQKKSGKLLKNKLENYSEMKRDTLDSWKLLDDPGWEEIRKTADIFLRSFSIVDCKEKEPFEPPCKD